MPVAAGPSRSARSAETEAGCPSSGGQRTAAASTQENLQRRSKRPHALDRRTKLQVGFIAVRPRASRLPNVVYPRVQFECRSGSFRFQRWYASPSKYKARLSLHERGLTIPSSGRAFGTPLKSNVRHRTQVRMSTIHTRIATLADLDVVAPLFDAYRQFYEKEPDLTLAKSFIHARLQNDESVILLASNEMQDVIGFCQLYPTFCSVEAKAIYSLYDLFVSPEERRSGAGRVLLQAAEKLAAANGKARMDLTTARTNKPAQAAYESLGWVRDEVFYAYSKSVDA